jgi:hypothetical protein
MGLWSETVVDGLLGGSAFPLTENSYKKMENNISKLKDFIM